MKVTLSKYAGFCGGVDRAYEIIKKAAGDPKVKKPIFVLGSLVHNQDVVDSIEKMGVRKFDLKTRTLADIVAEVKIKNGTLVTTAHGMGPEINELAEKMQVALIDTTCPRVTKAQKLAQVFAKRGYKIIIIGEKDHKEVKGINEWIDNKALFVEREADLDNLKLSLDEKIFILSQTTQNQDFVRYGYDFLKNKYKNAEFIDTLCDSTHNRQSEVKELAKENDLMIIIGSPESANSTRLWEISKKMNSSSYFIERLADIDKKWIQGKKSVGVSAGASTPPWIVAEVIAWLKSI